MRMAAILAVILALMLGTVAEAKSSKATVTGIYTYFVGGDPAMVRTLSVSAEGTDHAKGTWTWARPSGTYTGPVTCLRVSGADAWFAGSAPGTGVEPITAVFFWVHDGGTPGKSAGDLGFSWAADPGETLDTMEGLCKSMSTSFYGNEPFSLVAGDVTVTPGK